ncbi:cytidine deaminase-like protein [Melanomma pulvis-pyrius CBS 109.77]|uniref:Cytidine deaminase-like protein n=1 Tax=Melanomma pulvis-pyrius CBS 109.77 TaxID=1314802 RepID=A0A6A6X7L2_9PLEO|nr:cytidine deaminase-like protein [Melanomma pulvis-pyrius CBS 109.77]
MSTPDAAASSIEPLGIVARRGQLLPLKTKDEVRAALETYRVYVVEVPAKHANAVKDVIQAALPDLRTSDFGHLRRVVQFKFLPPHLQKTFSPPSRLPRGDEEEEPNVSEDALAEELDAVRFFLVSPTRYIQHADLLLALRQKPPFDIAAAPPRILYATVPALAPTSAEQAARWSIDYWPIAYKNTNPYGPHPSLVTRNTAEIQDEVGHWLALAKATGGQICGLGLGENIGCVVVDKTSSVSKVIAVTGDCRWRSPTGGPMPKEGHGNVMAHAVERAIAMVAKKRLRVARTDPNLLDRQLFCDSPLTDLERHFFAMDNLLPNGYLCVDLDIYITHEPCVMCSMAILHSRFRRCVIGRRMPLTGGLSADVTIKKDNGGIKPGNGLGHGIFWRPSELNWKFLAWDWVDEDNTDAISSIKDTMHV